MYRNHKKTDIFEAKFSKPKKRKEDYGEFGIYCSKLMKHSLITGFSVIAASKSTARRTIKSFVFLICTAGFIYQTYYFLEMYLAFPIILDISVIYPESVDAPAITMCNRNRLLRQLYCEKFHQSCSWKYDYKSLCETFPKFCPSIQPKNFVLGVLEMRDLTNLDRSIQLLNAAGPQNAKHLIAGCSIKGVGKKEQCRDQGSVVAAKDGKPFRCFSVMSLVGKPDENPMHLSLTDEYNIILNLHPEDYMDAKELIQAYVFVHDPRSVTNPTAEGVTLKAGLRYKLYVSMTQRESLPPPYKSNCMDYVSEWKKNGGYGPVTKRGCTEMCKIKAMMGKFGCVGQSTTYPNEFPICNNASIVSSEAVNEKCSENCENACDLSQYSITTEVIEDIGEKVCNEDLHCINNVIGISVSFSRMTITKYKHEPKFQSVEMFSYIGGYMGMWLGLSLVSLFDFVEMIFDVLAYPYLKWKASKKKTVQIENMQRAATTMFHMYDI